MKPLKKQRSYISIAKDSSGAARNKTRTQLIRVQRGTYEKLDAMRVKFKLPVTELIRAMVESFEAGRKPDFKQWREDMPAQGRMTHSQRWANVEKTTWSVLRLQRNTRGAPRRLPIEALIEECEKDVSITKPQVERALNNWKAEGIVRIDFTRNEVWSEDWKASDELMEVRVEALGLK